MQTNQNNESGSVGVSPRRCHYCRGCGCALAAAFRGHFHKECLRADKRSRISEHRQREQQRFKRWLKKERCLNCGAEYGYQRTNRASEGSCEASQAAQERDPLSDENKD